MTENPTAAPPPWDRRYVCPQCPLHMQPSDGFEFVAFHEHVSAHAIWSLREAVQAADRQRHALESLEALFRPPEGCPDFVGGWPVETTRLHALFLIDQGLDRPPDPPQKDRTVEGGNRRAV